MQTLKPRVQLLRSNIKSAVRSVRITGNSLQKIRREFFARNPLCCMCTAEGRTGLATELDHITPLWMGGHDVAENRQGLCHDHHAGKTAHEARLRYGSGGRGEVIDMGMADEVKPPALPKPAEGRRI